MNTTQTTTEGAAIMATKAAPPAAVSLATIAAYPALAVGLLLDLIVNTTVASAILLVGWAALSRPSQPTTQPAQAGFFTPGRGD